MNEWTKCDISIQRNIIQPKERMKYSYYNMDGLEVLMLCDRRQTQWSHLYEGLPWWLSYKESACNPGAAGDLGSTPGLGRSPGEGNGNPLPDSCLEKPRDRGAWRAIVCVSQSQTTEQLTLSLSLWASLVAQLVKNPPAMQETWARSLGGEDPLEKGTTTHSSILAWIIPWTEEPGGLPWGCEEWNTKERVSFSLFWASLVV